MKKRILLIAAVALALSAYFARLHCSAQTWDPAPGNPFLQSSGLHTTKRPFLRASTKRAASSSCKCWEVFATLIPDSSASPSTVRSVWHKRSSNSTLMVGDLGRTELASRALVRESSMLIATAISLIDDAICPLRRDG